MKNETKLTQGSCAPAISSGALFAYPVLCGRHRTKSNTGLFLRFKCGMAWIHYIMTWPPRINPGRGDHQIIIEKKNLFAFMESVKYF